MKIKPIKFPRDGLAHDNIIEWWYFNGHLKDNKGNKYAFMNCLFKVDLKKVKIPFMSKQPFKTGYFSHSILSDITAKKFLPNIDYVSLVSRDSFSRPLLFVNYINPVIVNGYVNKVIEGTGKLDYHIKNDDFDLNLTSVKKPLLENGKGFVNIGSEGSYYYSLTNLKTKGIIKVGDKHIKVKGKSWMDHQWANSHYNSNYKWTWFSLQLDNNTEIVCFEFIDGKSKKYLATISYENNRQVSTDDVILTPTGIVWESPVTKTKYPLSWKIEIPSKKINLEVKPLLKEQEVLFGTITYWEGPLEVNGTLNKKKVNGVGFAELVGYPRGISNLTLYRKEINKTIKKPVSIIKEDGMQIIRDILKRKGNNLKTS